MTKGAPVHFIGGKYGGKKGWINLEDDNDNVNVTAVITNLGKKEGEENLCILFKLS